MKKIKKCINGTYVQQNDNTNIYLRNNIRKIENPNFDYRTWLELTDEEKQSIIENTAPDITNMLSKEGKAALKWNKTKGRGYDIFDIRTSKDILNTRKENELNNIKKWFKENTGDNFKCGGTKRVPRKKAFWGTLITAIAGLGAGVAKTIMNSKEQEKQMQFELDKQKLLADEQNATRQTQADTEFYNNINANSGVYSDLHKGLKAKYGKKVRCKKSNGGFEWTGNDTGDVISSLLNIGTDLSTTAIQNNMNDNIRQTMLVTGQIGPNHNAINPNFNNLKNNNQNIQPIDETAIQYNTNLQNRKVKRLNSWYLS